MANFFFEIPWWIPTVTVLAGVVLFISGNARVEKRLLHAGIALACIGVLLAAVSYFFDSDREKVIKRTRQLIEAVAAKDWDRATPLLHPDVTLHKWGSRQRLIRGCKDYSQKFEWTAIRITSLDAQPEDPDIVASVSVLSDHKLFNMPSSWRMEWIESDNGWVLKNIELVQIAQQSGKPLMDQYFSE